MAWLLATARTLGPATELAQRDAFVPRLREAGVACDLSRVSRWESGQQAVPARVVVAYESVLGLPSGALLAPGRGVLRSSSPSVEMALVSEHADEADDLVQDVIATALHPDRPVSGGSWLSLGMELCSYQRMFLEADTWSKVCNRLIRELCRTVGLDHLRRYEACVAFVQHPMAQRRILRALGEWLTHPDVEVVAPMMGLLKEITEDAASELTLRLLGSQNPLLAQNALPVAAAKAAQGQFPLEAMPVLEHLALCSLRGADGWTSGIDAVDLAVQLPDASFDRIVRAVRDGRLRRRLTTARETMALAPPEVMRTVVRGVATQAQAMTPAPYAVEPDVMLQRLVKEVFFHVSSHRRQLAARTLAASPYAAALADCCVELTGDSSDFLAERAWFALFHLGHGHRRSELVTLALHEPRPRLQSWGLISVGLGRQPLSTEEQQHVAAIASRTQDEDVRSSALYALGMAGPGSLSTVRDCRPDLSSRVSWWTTTGPVIQDADAMAGAR